MSLRPAVVPLVATAAGYTAFPLALLVAAQLEGPMWEPENARYAGEVTLGWSVVSLAALAVSCTSLAYVAGQLRWWPRLAVLVLNIPLVAAAAGGLYLSIMGFQDYAAGHAAYDAAVQVCGHEPVVVAGAGHILLPGEPDYDRQRYETHQHVLLGGDNLFFCTEAEAIAKGYRR